MSRCWRARAGARRPSPRTTPSRSTARRRWTGGGSAFSSQVYFIHLLYKYLPMNNYVSYIWWWQVRTRSPVWRCSFFEEKKSNFRLLMIWTNVHDVNVNVLRLIPTWINWKHLKISDESDAQFITSKDLKVVIRGLEKFTNYSIQVLAYTRMGEGIRSRPIYVMTQQDRKYFSIFCRL